MMALLLFVNSANVHNNMLNIRNALKSLCTNGQINSRTIVTGMTTSKTHIQNGIPRNVQSFSQYLIQNVISNVQENSSFINQPFLQNQPYV